MRTLLSIVCLVFLIASAPARSERAKTPALIGQWSVDVSRLPMPPEARPKRVTISFAEAASGGLEINVEVIDAGGARVFADSTSALDGMPSPVRGNLEADIAATTMPAPNVLVMQLAKGGVPASTRVYAVSEDGKSMIETVAYFDDEGKPKQRANYFSRVR